MRIITILLLFIVQQFTRADEEQDESNQWKYPQNCTGYACDYRAQWWYFEKTDEIKFIISTKFRNKWTGIGFSDGQQMKGTDTVLGLVEDNGRYFLMDTYLSGYQAPPLDAVQNIHNMSVWRENGITHLQFHRFRTTSDPEYDFQFTDDHCAYFHFPIKGGVFNAVNKRMRKHEETPKVSSNRICIRSKSYKDSKNKKAIEVPIVVPPSIRYPSAVPNKPKIPTRFKARPKLTNLLATTSTTTSSTTSTTTSTTASPIQLNSIRSSDSTTNNLINLKNQKPNDQPTTLPVDFNKLIDNDKSFDQTTSIKPTTLDTRLNVVNASTQSSIAPELSTATSVTSLNANENVNSNDNSNSIEVINNKSNEPKSEIKNESKNEDKLEYGDEDEETTNLGNENSINNKKPTISTDDKSSSSSSDKPFDQDGRISTDINQNESTIKSSIKAFNFDLKILNSASTNELNSTIVQQEAEKELSDLTGFKQLKLITLKPVTTSESNSKPISWIVDFEMQMNTEPDTNETDYLAYIQNALNETLTTGHIGSLMLDTSHYAQLRQDFNQTKQEAKYAFEYNFFNQLTIKLTKEQLRLAYIVLAVSLLILLVIMQACCMCCTSNESTNDLNKQNNLSNSSTLQDKHQLNMHHHAQYNDYIIKNCNANNGNNYSYENFGLDASDVSPGYDSSYKMKHYKHSLSKHDPMIYNNYQNYQNSYNRRPDFGYNFNNYHHNHHGSSSHHRYFEPQPMQNLEPDFYFMPKQRINHKCYN